MDFRITLEKTPPPDHPEEKPETRVVTVSAPSCCEACVAAMKANTGFSFTKWEKLGEKSREATA